MAKKATRRGDASARPIAIVSADWHAAESSFVRSQIAGDAIYGISQLVDAAIERQVPLVGAGDLFDVKRPPSHVLAAVHDEISRLAAARVPCYFIAGDHDEPPTPTVGDRVHWLRACAKPWATHIGEGHTCEIGGLVFSGIDYMPAGMLQDRIAVIHEDTAVVVMHQIVRELRSGEMIPYAMTLDQLPTRLKAAIFGDWHRHQVVNYHRIGLEPLVVLSPGPVALTAIDEPDSKFAFVLNSDLSVAALPLRCRPVLSDVIASEDELNGYLDRVVSAVRVATSKAADAGIPPHIRVPILDVRASHDIVTPRDRIRRVVGEEAHVHIRSLPREKREEDEAPVDVRQVSFDEAAAAVSSNKAAVKLASRLYRGDDRTVEILAKAKDRIYSR